MVVPGSTDLAGSSVTTKSSSENVTLFSPFSSVVAGVIAGVDIGVVVSLGVVVVVVVGLTSATTSLNDFL